MIHMRASPRGLATVVICAALVVIGCGVASAQAAKTEFVFDVTVTYAVGGSWTYGYDLQIVEPLSSAIQVFWLEGAYGIDPGSIGHTDEGAYTWYDGDILEPGDLPSWDGQLGAPGYPGDYQNIGSHPAIVWGVSSAAQNQLAVGPAGTFWFTSSQGPHQRDWYVYGCGLDSDTGVTVGPTPELSPILLMLGQGVPILGWIGFRRRRQS